MNHFHGFVKKTTTFETLQFGVFARCVIGSTVIKSLLLSNSNPTKNPTISFLIVTKSLTVQPKVGLITAEEGL